ncbi:MAG: uroporphyrinogen decarboxylase family protein [Desulfobacterales bacterium]
MREPNGKYYMVSALKRLYADRLPLTVLTGPYCSRLAHYTIKEILTDAKKSVEAHLAFYHRFKPDSLIVYNDIYLEAEALGCKLEFFDDRTSHPKLLLLENKSQLARLKIPDPSKDGRIPYFMEVCQGVSSRVRKTATVGLGHSGPWNIAIHLRGVESLLMDTVDDPEFVHELMNFTTEVVKTVGDALIEAGFAPSLGEAAASCSLISPTIFKEFIKPYHKELCGYFRSKGALTALHICGYIDPVMEEILDSNISILSLDAPSSLKNLVELSAGRVTAMGNVHTSLFADGSRGDIEQAIRNCIETAAGGRGYILASGCEIPLDSTEDRIEHFFNYGRQFSREFMSKLREKRPELFEDSLATLKP